MNQFGIKMNHHFLNSRRLYVLLLAPVISAVLALLHFGFVFKSGTAGFGILILLILYFDRLRKTKDVLTIMAAFAFSIVGDWFLSNKHGDTGMFVYGIVFFFFAHFGYLLFALMNGKMKWGFFTIVVAAYLLFFFLKLYPYIGNEMLMGSALVYLIVSCFSLGAAVGLRTNPVTKGAYVFGIFLILFSDTIIAYKEFVGFKELNFLILPTYYLAHIAIVFSLMKRRLIELKEITEQK
jgi:uncharacterized membrane protein YhhN